MQKSSRQLQKEQTRRKIIEAAFKVYSEKGFTASTGEIAKEAEVAHGSIFLHFPTLDDLLSCLLISFGDSLCARFHELSERGADVRELLNSHVDALAEYETFYTRLISEQVLLPEAAKTTLAAIQSGLAFHFNEVVNREIGAGVLKRLPPHIMFNAWVGLIHYYLQNKIFFEPEGSVLKRYKKQLIFTYCELMRRQ